MFYVRAVDSTMLTALSAIASDQSASTEKNEKIQAIFRLCGNKS